MTALGSPARHEPEREPDLEAATARPLAGRTVVITGASDGIGAAAARHLVGLGAQAIVVGRSAEKTAAVAGSIGATALTADFSRLEDVRRVADQILALCPRIDVLANNAGTMAPTRIVTVDGNELTFQVNYLAGFLLTGLLMPRLTATPGSRVLTTSSMINPAGRIDLDDLDRSRRHYRQFAAYADSKLANILFVRELARRVTDGATAGPTATAFHPGMVRSQFGRDVWYLNRLNGHSWNRFVTRTPEQGAAPLIALAIRPDPHAVNGAYLHRFKHRERLLTARQSRNEQLARQLWERSAELVGLPG